MTTPPPSAIAVCFAGMLSLAAAMGIGRFAFTPVLPLMIRDELLQVADGAWLAASNYVGYLVGALAAARITLSPTRLAWACLAGIAVTTAAMTFQDYVGWLALRFAAGAFSAGAFVATSVWSLGALSRFRRPELAPIVYAGVGLGIGAAGTYCFLAAVLDWASAIAWIHLGILAAVLAVPVLWVLHRLDDPTAGHVLPGRSQGSAPPGTVGLVACYGIMGFGYILPATFLPAMALEVTDDSIVFGSAWPVFGLTAAASTLVAGTVMRRISRLRLWAASQGLMAIGALLPSVVPTPTTIVLSAILVGSTFMVITLAGVQEIRALVPSRAGPWVGHLTASFALGQIAGPAAAALLLSHPAMSATAMALSLQIASAALAFSAAWLWCLGSSTSNRGR